MPSGKSRIKGTGTEVLVGVPRAVSIKPEAKPAAPEEPQAAEVQPEAQPAAEPASPPAEPATGLPSLAEAELGAALYEEAQAAEPGGVEEEAPWIAKASWPPTPEMELALIEHDQAAGVQPAQATAPVAEAPVAEAIAGEGQAIPEAALPARPADAYLAPAETEVFEELDIQAPEEKVERIELPERPLTQEEERELAEQTSARIRELNEEIDRVYEQVLNEVGESEPIATQCYNDLLRARDIILRRDVARLAQAEYYIEQARARLKRAQASGVGARRNAWWIFAWGLLWGMVLVASLILLDTAYVQDMIALLKLRSPFVDPKILLPAMVWGGLGGVVAIWYSLFKHIALRDFDGHYNITYIGKPFFGLVLGATVYMIINLLLVSLGVWPTTAAEGASVVVNPTIAPWIIYLLSWVAGFKENRIFGLVEQVMKRIFPSEPTTSSSTTSLLG